jgi:hypothetical protein
MSVVRVYDIAKRNPYSVAKAYRRIRNDGTCRKFLSFAYNTLFRVIYSINSKDVNGSPKVFSANILWHIDLQSEGSFIDAEFLIKANHLGYKIIEHPVVSNKRVAGSSKVGLSMILDMFWALVAFKVSGHIRRWKKRTLYANTLAESMWDCGQQ